MPMIMRFVSRLRRHDGGPRPWPRASGGSPPAGRRRSPRRSGNGRCSARRSAAATAILRGGVVIEPVAGVASRARVRAARAAATRMRPNSRSRLRHARRARWRRTTRRYAIRRRARRWTSTASSGSSEGSMNSDTRTPARLSSSAMIAEAVVAAFHVEPAFGRALARAFRARGRRRAGACRSAIATISSVAAISKLSGFDDLALADGPCPRRGCGGDPRADAR